MSNQNRSRIDTLDWLRGLMALSIMFYHLTYWLVIPLDASSPLGRIGIYGVSVFFILSGLSMAVVYSKFINSFKTSLSFFVRRLFRIWPLLWIVCLLVILPQLLKNAHIRWDLFFLNATTAFGFVDPTAYIATGTWSIGNEMVYYALTPMIINLYNYRKWAGNVFFIIALCVGLFFAFFLLKPDASLGNQWSLYVNPFNNLFLYVMGISMYYNFKDVRIDEKVNNLLLIVSVVLFCFLPFKGDLISIVSGGGRIVFVLLSFLIVLSFYKLDVKLPKFLRCGLETSGIATYGVYLIHPVVYLYLSEWLKMPEQNHTVLMYGLVVVVTIVTAVLSYRLFESKLIKLGKKATSRIFPVKAIA